MKKILLILVIGGVLGAGLYSKYFKHVNNAAVPTAKKENIADQLQPGDIIFQTSGSRQSKAIQLATRSKYSHMGILFFHDNELMVLEAVQPVKYTKFNEWTRRGDGHHFIVRRLADTSPLTEEKLEKMKAIGDAFLDKSYDSYFEWSDDKIYCSELVWKIYSRTLDLNIGKLQALKSFDLANPAVKTKLRERYKNRIPLEEKVISPQAMFSSDLLTTVVEK